MKRILIIGIIAIFLIVAVFYIFLRSSEKYVRMNGDTMEPTYAHGELLRVDYDFQELKRGDIIEFKLPSEKTDMLLVKRIVGLPNEKIEIIEGKVLINGERLDETFYFNKVPKATSGSINLQLKNNEYFVLGDNRDKSFDSRNWGALPKKNITAKVIGKP